MARGCTTALVLALAAGLLGCRPNRPPPSFGSEGQPDPEAAPPTPADDVEVAGAPEADAAGDDDDELGAPPPADGVAIASHYAGLGRDTCESELKK